MPALFDDVAFGPLNIGIETEQVKKRLSNALETVGLADMAGKTGHHLSAGQKHPAAIATILSMAPKIITLDEPDGSLYPGNRKKFVKLLCGLSQTLITATCNMNFAALLAERAVLIAKGRIIADGDVRTVMSDSKLMNEYGLEVPVRFQ